MHLKLETHRKANKEKANLKRKHALKLHLSIKMVVAEGATPKSLTTIVLDRCVPYLICTQALIGTDGLSGYEPLVQDGSNLKQILSEK
jgi:hypothetical protein